MFPTVYKGLKMTTIKHFCTTLACVATLALTGCVTNVSTLSPDTKFVDAAQKEKAELSTKTAFIRKVVDERKFRTNAAPDKPTWSNDGSHEEGRAIGRKRNSFGKALGGFVLPAGFTAADVVRKTLGEVLTANGYKVLGSEGDVKPETKVIDVDMTQFWMWMNPGFWQLTLSADINSTVRQEGAEPVNVKGEYHEGFQVGTDSNYLTVLNTALRTFYEDAVEKLK